MGTWGVKNFENDGAADFVYDVCDNNGKEVIKTSLLKIVNAKDDYLDASDCEEALAAAEIVAGAKGQPSEDLPEEIKEWLPKNDILTTKKFLFSKKVDLVNLAIQTVTKILSYSELKELWEESEELEVWSNLQTNLIERLK